MKRKSLWTIDYPYSFKIAMHKLMPYAVLADRASAGVVIGRAFTPASHASIYATIPADSPLGLFASGNLMRRVLLIITALVVIGVGGFFYLLGRADHIKPSRTETSIELKDDFPK